MEKILVLHPQLKNIGTTYETGLLRVQAARQAAPTIFIPTVFNVSIQIDYYSFNKHEAYNRNKSFR